MPKNKALFLDRDGVINVERGYVHRRKDFQFSNGIFELCKAAQVLCYRLVVVTNQAGIARGYYSDSEFQTLTEWMTGEFAARQIEIARVYYCPYHEVHGVGAYKVDSPDRKPKPGMLLKARTDFNLNLRASVIIGDQRSDMYAAEAAGVGTAILLSSGNPKPHVEGDRYYIESSLDNIRCRFFPPSGSGPA